MGEFLASHGYIFDDLERQAHIDDLAAEILASGDYSDEETGTEQD